MTPTEVQQVLTVLGAAYPATEITDEMVALWINTLADDETSRVRTAVEQYVRSEEWFPTPASLRQYVRDVARREQMDTPSNALPEGRGQYPTFAEGIQIAYESYSREVRRQGREPKTFDQFRHNLTGLGVKAQPQRAYR